MLDLSKPGCTDSIISEQEKADATKAALNNIVDSERNTTSPLNSDSKNDGNSKCAKNKLHGLTKERLSIFLRRKEYWRNRIVRIFIYTDNHKLDILSGVPQYTQRYEVTERIDTWVRGFITKEKLIDELHGIAEKCAKQWDLSKQKVISSDVREVNNLNDSCEQASIAPSTDSQIKEKAWEKILSYVDGNDLVAFEEIGALSILKRAVVSGVLDMDRLMMVLAPLDEKQLDGHLYTSIHRMKGRMRPRRELTESEISEIYRAAQDLGVDTKRFAFNKTRLTGYDTHTDRIHLYGDVLPCLASNWLADRISMRCVLAHEHYHAMNRYTKYPANSIRDEFITSWQAHKSTELKLTDLERHYLKYDAIRRLFGIDLPITLVDKLFEVR